MAEMYIKKMIVTPGLAEYWLLTNPRNRSIKRDKVSKIESSILNGTFELTHQCIAIDENGMLIDGHHRLNAVVNTRTPVEMIVMFNAPNSSKIDIGVSRSERDSLYMAGVVDKGTVEYNCLTYPLCTFILQRNFPLEEVRSFSAETKHIVYIKLKDHIDAVILNLSGGKARSSLILYAMLCAEMAGVPHEKLKNWHKIVSSGDFFVEGNEKLTKAGRSVLLFKNFIEDKSIWSNSSLEKRNEVIKKAMSSIKYYAASYPNTKLYGEFVYPEVTITKNDLNGGKNQ